MENQITQKWFQKPITVILFLIFFFPVGLYLMWKNELWSKTVRVVVSVFFGLLVLVNINKGGRNSEPDSGVYRVNGDKTDIYCGSSTFIEIKKCGEERIVEFYSESGGVKACVTEGSYKMDKNGEFTIYGLSNQNTFGAAEQFNGSYKWGDDEFGIRCLFKDDSGIKLINYKSQ